MVGFHLVWHTLLTHATGRTVTIWSFSILIHDYLHGLLVERVLLSKLLLAIGLGRTHYLLLIGHIEMDVVALTELRSILANWGGYLLLNRVVLGWLISTLHWNHSILDLLQNLRAVWTFDFQTTGSSIFSVENYLLSFLVEGGRPVLWIRLDKLSLMAVTHMLLQLRLALIICQHYWHCFGALRRRFDHRVCLKARFWTNFDQIPLECLALESAPDVYVKTLLFGSRSVGFWVLHQTLKSMLRAVVLDAWVCCPLGTLRALNYLWRGG